MRSEPSRTIIGSVVCVDLVGYSRRSVAQQGAIKAEFNRLLSQVLKPIRPEDRIILDTGDGAAVTFLGDPDDCLSIGLQMREVFNRNAGKLGAEPGEGPARIGIHLGPLRVAVDLNGHPNIVGDGIVVAERIAAFARPGEIVASRSFHDMVSRLSDEHLAMFRYEGRHADRNAREHEIYLVADPRRKASAPPRPVEAAAVAPPPPVEKPVEPAPLPVAAASPPAPQAATPAPAPQAAPASVASKGPPSPQAELARRPAAGGLVAFLRNRTAVGATAVLLLVLIFAEAWMIDQRRARATTPEPQVQAPPKVAAPAPKEEPPRPAEGKAEAAPPVAALNLTPPPPAPPAEPPRPVEAATAAVPKAEAPVPRAVVPPTKGVPPRAEPPRAEPKAAPKAEPRTEPAPPPGSPAAIAAQARERAAEAARATEAKAAPRKLEEAPKPTPIKPATPPTISTPAPTVAVPAPTAPMPAPSPPPAPATQEAPPPQVAAATQSVTPISRAEVSFPRAAARQGIEAGTVKARLTIGADGRVTDVKVLDSSPPGVFEREAIRSLGEWRFNTGAAGRRYDVEIAFKR